MWPFRRNQRAEQAGVSLDEVTVIKPNQVGIRYGREPHVGIWLAGDLTDIGLTVEDLGVTVHRRFSSPTAMFHAALGTVEHRQRLQRRGEGPPGLLLLMSEAAFRAYRTEKRFRRVLDHSKTCHIGVFVVCSWLRPLHES